VAVKLRAKVTDFTPGTSDYKQARVTAELLDKEGKSI
jgi:hypothetical protein